MLKNLKLGTQIGLGFSLVVITSAFMVGFAIKELRTGSESFKTYRSLARASVLSGPSPGQHADRLECRERLSKHT